ncbi:hypothetical protein D3C78_1709820 [compost metagenome]
MRGQFQQVADREYPQTAGQAGFLGVFLWHHQGASGSAGGQGGGQYALDRAQRAG